MKNFAILIKFLLILCVMFLCPFSNIFAQKIKSELLACNESEQARYECFLEQRKGQLERAKKIAALRRSIIEAKEELRFELKNLEKKQREKEKKEMMKQVELSRLRNVSHKGEKYSINYGHIIEASP